MDNRLQATTEPGRTLVSMAEEFAADFATRSAAHDRDASFPHENLGALRSRGYLYAPVPVQYGGMGVDSVHDVFVASSRLAEADPSLTLGVNMHHIVLMAFRRQYEIACSREDRRRVESVGRLMQTIARERWVIGAAVSEPDQDLLRQQTTARCTEDGWVVSGRKIFTSMAPAATHFSVSLAYVDDAGVERYAYGLIPSDAPGVTVNDDWDAMGMRASGSVSVVFNDARLPGPPGMGAVAGQLSAEHLQQILTSGAGHATASVGIAEAAHRLAIESAAAKRAKKGDGAIRPTVRHLAAENAIDIAAVRAIFGRALRMIDELHAANPTGYAPFDDASGVFAEVQAAKQFVNQAAVRVADRALAICGGGAYMSANPLSRLYRDARAGAFMHPLGANVAYEYLGAVTLGIEPDRL